MIAGDDPSRRPTARGAGGQAAVLVIGGLMAILVLALVLGSVAKGIGVRASRQQAADLAALAGARAMLASYLGLFEPASVAGRPNPLHVSRDAYLARGRSAAERVAEANDAPTPTVGFPDGTSFAPVRIRVGVADDVTVERRSARRRAAVSVTAEAELAPPGGAVLPDFADGGGYDGPLAYRQGKPMRPDVASAFDRLERAARADGLSLIITSAFRSDAEQAVLFARHPDPKWVAPPGRSLHRNGTELDLGPPAAYGWLAANAPSFRFLKRYSWEPWHFGYTLNPRSSPRDRSTDGNRAGTTGLPGFVPVRYAAIFARAAQRWNVSAALLAAQVYAESNFNPYAVSGAGAQGIAQFMPATARAIGLRDPFDAEQAIDAQAHLMRDLLRRFGSVPLALAAYNAGPAPVQRCGCIPPYPETRGYVARILGLLSGAGEAPVDEGLVVRLVE